MRACSTFVDLLPTILRTALVLAAVLFLQEFRDLAVDRAPPAIEDDALPQVVEADAPADEPTQLPEPVMNDRIRHFLNCTYEEYRSEHFDECVERQSNIYRPPEAGPDETGALRHEWPVLQAGLAQRTDGEPIG